jgi:peptide-methionine (S)-S-oxide reductase
MLFFSRRDKTRLPDAHEALPGRTNPMPVAARHAVLDAPLDDPFEGMAFAMFGMGCFWGAEKTLWNTPGVVSTSVGYSAGHTPNATYEEVCSGRTGHNEVVRVVFDPAQLSYADLLRVFWENHNPTQGMRQGNDVGTSYRSGVYWYDEPQRDAALASKAAYQAKLRGAGYGAITTEIVEAGPYYFAEGYHQQYLAKNPGGYCGIGGTGVSCPIGLDV